MPAIALTWPRLLRRLFPVRWRIGPLLLTRDSVAEREQLLADALRAVELAEMPGGFHGRDR